MKGRIVRSIAVIVASSVVALTSAGVAAAGGKGNSSTEAAGAQVVKLRDQLARDAYAGDNARTSGTLGKLNPLLADLAAGKRYSIQAESQSMAGDVHKQGVQTARYVADPRQLPPVPGLPGDPLAMVKNLVMSLVDALCGLVKSLLGGGAPSLPPLPTPPLPVPTPPLPTP
ncbi:hypothetical protein [Amycolatopsis anabasis]|uniref:hypothetical protein n=1 Tax=Amycolatopsis anabasis TaxID=1840409 RepID=UPI00131AC3AE|nr:hypothetical protein [Amycolatopsis anabasis]